MSSKKQTGVHGNKTEANSDLSRHYRQIGIKAVAAAVPSPNAYRHVWIHRRFSCWHSEKRNRTAGARRRGLS
jgi:dihydrodipicolinate synthase/N-acetylneuraminate lyase